MAGIDFSKFSQDFKAKFEKAIADKKIYAEEFQEFSAEDQAELSRQLANTPGHIGDIIVIQNAYKSKQGTLEFYAGADSQEGKVELSQDTISKYPNAGKFGNFNKGVVTILDKDGKVLKDSLGNPIKFDFSTDLEIDSTVDNVQGGFETIEGENFQRTNRRFAIALIRSMYDKVIVENQKMLEQLGLLNASLWREGLGMGIQKIADSIDADQKAITATTAKKIEQMVEERDKICNALEKQLDNPSGFSDEFSKLVGSNFSDMNFDKLRETCHNKENEKDDTIRYNKTVEDFNEMYPNNKVTKYLEGNFVTQSLDKMVKLCDSVADILVMFWTTGGIGGTLGKASMKGFANCSKFFIKDICEKNYKEAIAQLPKLSSFMAGAAHSAPTMSAFEGGKALINSATNGEDLTADEIFSRTIDGFIRGAFLAVVPGRIILRGYEFLTVLLGRLSFCTWIGGKPEVWQIVGYYLVLAAAVWIYRAGVKKSENGKIFAWKIRAVYAGMVCFVILLISYRPHEDFRIACLDVGQGDGIVVEIENRWNILIDGGSTNKNELGKYQLLPYLKSRGISRLDGIYVSHTDEDHISGVRELLEFVEKDLTSLRIENLILPKWSDIQENKNYRELTELAESAGVRVLTVKAGDEIRYGTVRLKVLWPESGASGKEVNEDAMVLEMISKDFKGLFTGDIGMETEEKLIQNGCLEDVDFLKTAHHGSRYSTGAEFLEIVRPELSVVSCSATNTYGHPSPDTLERLKKSGSRVLITRDCGAVTIVNGKSVSAFNRIK